MGSWNFRSIRDWRDADEDGIVTLPNTPGLGVDIDPAFLGKLHHI